MRIDAGGFLSLTQIRRSELATSSTKSGGGFTGKPKSPNPRCRGGLGWLLRQEVVVLRIRIWLLCYGKP